LRPYRAASFYEHDLPDAALKNLSELHFVVGDDCCIVPDSVSALKIRQFDFVGNFGISQPKNASVERDCISTRPGPVSKHTSPSPPRMVDFQLPDFCTLN